MGAGKDTSYRAYRASEFAQNQRLKLQAALQTKMGGLAASGSRLAASGGNISGNIVQRAEATALVQAAIERARTMSQLSYQWQKGGGRTIAKDSVSKRREPPRALKAGWLMQRKGPQR